MCLRLRAKSSEVLSLTQVIKMELKILILGADVSAGEREERNGEWRLAAPAIKGMEPSGVRQVFWLYLRAPLSITLPPLLQFGTLPPYFIMHTHSLSADSNARARD